MNLPNIKGENLRQIQDILDNITSIKGKKYSMGVMILVNQYTAGISVGPSVVGCSDLELFQMAHLTSQVMVANMALVAQLIATEDNFLIDPIGCIDELEKNFKSVVASIYPPASKGK